MLMIKLTFVKKIIYKIYIIYKFNKKKVINKMMKFLDYLIKY